MSAVPFTLRWFRSRDILAFLFVAIAGVTMATAFGQSGPVPQAKPEAPCDDPAAASRDCAARPGSSVEGTTRDQPPSVEEQERRRQLVRLLIFGGVAGHPFGFFK